MAVAVKNSSETASPSLLDRFAVVSLLGVGYVYAGIALVFYGLPALWWNVLGLTQNAVGYALLIIVMALTGLGVAWGGGRLLLNAAREGLRASVFATACALVLILALASGVGTALESYAVNPSAGAPATAGVLVVLLVMLGRVLATPAYEQRMINLENQGWFTAVPFKSGQGQMVRRGTILAVLALALCGVYVLFAHDTLQGASADWYLPLPYATHVEITGPGDSSDLKPGAIVSREELAKEKADLDQLVKVGNPGDSTYASAQMVPVEEFRIEDRKLRTDGKLPPERVTPAPPESLTYPRLTIFPHVKLTLPILLFLASFWFAYRVVNYPVFADFLIATEAEMNKVSWTSRKNLVQDTIVVLVTVILLTTFLFAVDLVWAKLLTKVGVLQPRIETTKVGDDDARW